MVPSLTQEEYRLFRDLIKRYAGISYSRQKLPTLQRKLAARLTHLGLGTFISYYRYLLHDKSGAEELRELVNTITVDQTEFFRHARQFELLANIVLPQMERQKQGRKKLRIWSAGCATGQEAYSIAMVVNDAFGSDKSWDIKILASDIDTGGLRLAQRGKYPGHCIEHVPQEYVDKYLDKGTGGDAGFYTVKQVLKEMILFRRLNFTDGRFPFMTPVDIIFCRNVLIYFDGELKTRLIDRFFRILQRDGFLCLGASESLIGLDERFALVGHSTYQKTG
ncbi:MAG: CheR family methyltransferase [Thermodesulfobacteriota bacterium]|nr:CheR family methyltransferase [Thermodesulfobacteriota bacterium]